ncbi:MULTISPECIES: cell division protein ZipA C-terminal FtsZ-binding domain-containing protein [Candidatus Ichthyocystis]|uniref:cell division protein ZipA C-terminal FtsZ-binding domain-containing protein n=2 Tax=Burkholderiales genera incertae sedis TaxID=224471 RepID=UPI001584E486|nr:MULTISPECIES: cell division protein ZipA C-terminal FtsZ-binding domain-containing protein [Ichthyocystis]
MIKKKQRRSMDLRSFDNGAENLSPKSESVVDNGTIDEIDTASDFNVPILCADNDMHGFSTLQESLLDNGIYPNCLSDQVDDILIINFAEPVTHKDFAEFYSRVSSIPQLRIFYWHNLSGVWQPFRVSFETKRMVFSLQLCDRQSLISEDVIRYVHEQAESFAKSRNAVLHIDSVADVMSKAKKLSKLVSEVDASVAINIIPKRINFLGTKIRSLSEASACYYNSEWGYFSRISTNGVEQFRLTTLDGSPFDLDMMKRLSFGGVSFSLYLPHVVDPFDSFNQMLIVARQFVKSLDGQMVDDEHRPLVEKHFDLIRNMIEKWVSDMEVFNLIPGKHTSLRVFSESLVADHA